MSWPTSPRTSLRRVWAATMPSNPRLMGAVGADMNQLNLLKQVNLKYLSGQSREGHPARQRFSHDVLTKANLSPKSEGRNPKETEIRTPETGLSYFIRISTFGFWTLFPLASVACL